MASGGNTYLLAAHDGDVSASTPTLWGGSSPRPIVSRGDGTVFFSSLAGYALRTVSEPHVVIDEPGDVGSLGVGVVIDGHYGYFALVDLSTDRMQLVLHECS